MYSLPLRSWGCELDPAFEPFHDWGRGRGCNNFFPVLGENGTKIAPTGDIFGKLADHVGDHVVLSPERGCFGDLPGDEIIVSPPSPIVEPLLSPRIGPSISPPPEPNHVLIHRRLFCPWLAATLPRRCCGLLFSYACRSDQFEKCIQLKLRRQTIGCATS